jgi:hypothetical protein
MLAAGLAVLGDLTPKRVIPPETASRAYIASWSDFATAAGF